MRRRNLQVNSPALRTVIKTSASVLIPKQNPSLSTRAAPRAGSINVYLTRAVSSSSNRLLQPLSIELDLTAGSIDGALIVVRRGQSTFNASDAQAVKQKMFRLQADESETHQSNTLLCSSAITLLRKSLGNYEEMIYTTGPCFNVVSCIAYYCYLPRGWKSKPETNSEPCAVKCTREISVARKSGLPDESVYVGADTVLSVLLHGLQHRSVKDLVFVKENYETSTTKNCNKTEASRSQLFGECRCRMASVLQSVSLQTQQRSSTQ
ncbi:Hypothetical predicted protein [Scomber scombrus]|uniref:Uncharacterized protein n=1 Tax=Scomber scombrus TaxID=13677 RepID=A0AAV1MYM1_SCOSC